MESKKETANRAKKAGDTTPPPAKAGSEVPLQAQSEAKSDPPASRNQPEPFADRKAAATLSSIAIKLNPDGSPDFSGMRPSSKERLKQILSHPSVKAEFGAEPSAPVEPVTLPAEAIGGLLDGISLVRTGIYAKRFELPTEIAAQAANYTPQEKEILTGLIQKIAAKHSPEFLSKWGEEISLLVLAASLEMVKFRQATAAYQDALQRVPKPAPTPISGERVA